MFNINPNTDTIFVSIVYYILRNPKIQIPGEILPQTQYQQSFSSANGTNKFK